MNKELRKNRPAYMVFVNSVSAADGAPSAKYVGKGEVRSEKIYCPSCNMQHIDQGWYGSNPHQWHLC